MIDHPLQSEQPRAASYQLSDLPEVNHSAQYSHDAPQVYEPAHLEVATSKYENEKYSYSTIPSSSTTPYPTHAAELTSHGHMQIPNEKEVAPTRENKTIWGFQRRVFILACIVGGLIIIGIIVASVVAVVVTRNQQASQSGNQLGNNNGTGNGGDQTGRGNGNGSSRGGGGGPGTLLAQTSLAVANFTEEGGAQAAHHYVFAQSNSSELIASLWDSQNKTWSTVSISRIFSAMGDTNPNFDLNPLNGTPIAAFAYTNPSFQMRVYFLDTSRVIQELINTDPWLRPQGWKPGSLGFSSTSTSNTILVAREGSHLTALRPQCGTGSDCRNKFPPMVVIFQNPSNVVVLAKSPEWVPQTIAPAEARTVLGISGLIESPDITDFQWRLNFFQAGMFKEYGSNGGLGGWIDGKHPINTQFLSHCLCASMWCVDCHGQE